MANTTSVQVSLDRESRQLIRRLVNAVETLTVQNATIIRNQSEDIPQGEQSSE